MCRYESILGSGEALFVQLLTVAVIAISIFFWLLAYRRVGVELRRFTLPIAFWVVFGTLDITITTRCTTIDPLCEGNPLARAVFLIYGVYGPPIASLLWIALWAGLVLFLNWKKAWGAEVLSLALFYTLGAGHLFGFSSWFEPMCWIRKMEDALPYFPFLIGGALAGLHFLLARALRNSRPQKNRKGL